MKIRVFKNQFGTFETLLKSKMLNGEEIKYYLPVTFKRGTEPNEEKIEIDIVDGWLTCYLAKNGEPKPKFYINDYIGKQEVKKEEGLNIKPDELPFY